MRAIVTDRNTQEIIATVQTNHGMSIDEALQFAGVDIDEVDYDALTIEMAEEIKDPMFTQWDLTDPSQGTIEG